MPAEEPLADLLGLRRGAWTFLPVAPRRIEFAAAIRQRLLALRPAVVAVELPREAGGMVLEAIAALPEFSAVLAVGGGEEEEDSVAAVIEPGDALSEAVRTARELGARIELIGSAAAPLFPHADAYPDPCALEFIPYEKYIEQYFLTPPDSPGAGQRALAAAAGLQRLDRSASTAVVVTLPVFVRLLSLLAREQRQAMPAWRGAFRRAPIAAGCLGDVTEDCPYLQERYEDWRTQAGPEEGSGPPPRRMWLGELWREAQENYLAIYRGELAPWQRRQASRFLERLVRFDGAIAPSLFDLIAAARGVVDDNFAYEIWRLGTTPRYHSPPPDSEPARLRPEQVFAATRRLRLRQRYEREKRRLVPRAWKRRPPRDVRGWAAQLGGDAICSYPPEDIVIEDYGRFLRQKAKTMLGEDRSRVEPFTTSVLDGIDLRETIRRWHEGRLYVRETERVSGDTGAVVVIFDEDPEDRYPWLTTWLGEHSNESDMAFYSTPPFDNLVGPGIGRAEYGGFMMTLPPGRLMDVWTDPDYDFAESKPERLLLAALDYSLERHVVYVGPKPPRAIFRQIAARLGRQIVYIPLGALSPEKLRKIRVLHVLDSHERRRIAPRYIW
ncbi:MAG: hypothetical protein NZR01_14575 [Bryobacteraceae bacterium]|nr:hypothetical protein [Bryobacteraceae bacterium]